MITRHALRRNISNYIQNITASILQTAINIYDNKSKNNNDTSSQLQILTNAKRSAITTKYFITQYLKSILIYTNYEWLNTPYEANIFTRKLDKWKILTSKLYLYFTLHATHKWLQFTIQYQPLSQL